MTPHSVVDPATEDVVTEVESLDVGQVDAAVARAVAAGPAWRAVAPADRARLLRRFAAAVDAQVDELADLEVRGAGHTVGNARWEAGNVRDVLDYYAAAPERLFGRQGRGEAPTGDRHGEVPRHDDPDDAERLAEGDVDAARDGDLAPEVPLRRPGVVGEDVAHVARLPARVADGVPGVLDLEQGELLLVLADEVGEAPQQQGTVGGAEGPPGGARGRGPGDRGVRLLEGGEVDGADHLLGGGVDDVVRGGHSRSNPLLRAQSVTAALKAVISTSAALT